MAASNDTKIEPGVPAGTISRANSTPEPIGNTAGVADETSGPVQSKTPKGGVPTVTCPNCERTWPVPRVAAGTVVPCFCGYQIQVQAD